MHGLEQQWGDRITFVYLDIDDPRTDPFKRETGYLYQPHIFLFDGAGNITAQWLGPVTAEEITRAFEDLSP